MTIIAGKLSTWKNRNRCWILESACGLKVGWLEEEGWVWCRSVGMMQRIGETCHTNFLGHPDHPTLSALAVKLPFWGCTRLWCTEGSPKLREGSQEWTVRWLPCLPRCAWVPNVQMRDNSQVPGDSGWLLCPTMCPQSMPCKCENCSWWQIEQLHSSHQHYHIRN